MPCHHLEKVEFTLSASDTSATMTHPVASDNGQIVLTCVVLDVKVSRNDPDGKRHNTYVYVFDIKVYSFWLTVITAPHDSYFRL